MKKLIIFFTCILPFTLIGQVNFVDNTIITVESTPLNTQASDFGPSLVGDELWHSAYTEERLEQISQGRSKNLFYNLFATPVDSEGNLKQGKKLMLEKLSSGYHAGPVSFCEKTNELFITLSNYENAEVKNVVFQKKNIPLKIVIMKRNGNSWEYAGELPFNNPTYSIGHPASSVTGDTLIFTSNIPGKGIGSTDLYMAVRKNGNWGEMVNLGNKINTAASEMFPYLHKGKILFYASDGKMGGKGGFDIWYSVLSKDGFGEPVNLSALNSTADDFGLIVHPNEEIGYFVSNKNNKNSNDDIYKVRFNGSYQLELLVKDKKTLKPVSGIKVEFNDNKIDFTNEQGIIHRELEKATEYTAATSLDEYMNSSVSFSTRQKPYGTIQQELFIEKVEVGQKFVLNNIYYNYDKWDILAESERELDKLVQILKDNPSWRIELASHTDSRGTNEYNNVLSQKRSDSAVQYMNKMGILIDRIVAKGYGKSRLLNQCNEGVSCTEEQHRLNRRTEFTILEMD